MEIKYRELTSQESADNRCSVMLENKLQCPERASFSVLDKKEGYAPEQVLMCKHHFQIETQLGGEIGTYYTNIGGDQEPIPTMKQKSN